MSKSKSVKYSGVRPYGNSIQIEIRYKGRRFRPTLKLTPTAKNLRDAVSIRESIRRDIVLGILDIDKYLDNSKIGDFFEKKYSSKLTVSELLELWLKKYSNTKGRDAAREYEKSINNHLKPIIGMFPINDLKVKTITDMQDTLSEKLANKTINNSMIPLRQAFIMAFKHEMIESNPLDRVSNFKVETKKAQPISITEIDTVLKSMEPNPDHHNFYKFAIWTGLSTGEQIGLKWSDINFEDCIISIQRMWVRGKVRPVKAKGRRRDLELIQPAIDALLAQKALGYDSEWVFIDPNNDLPWRAETISMPWNKALKAANIPHRRAYCTRHTYSSVMLSAGMSLEWLKEKMGHSNYKMLEEVYASWTKVSSAERQKIRDWVMGRSQNGHIPDMEKDFFQQKHHVRQ